MVHNNKLLFFNVEILSAMADGLNLTLVYWTLILSNSEISLRGSEKSNWYAFPYMLNIILEGCSSFERPNSLGFSKTNKALEPNWRQFDLNSIWNSTLWVRSLKKNGYTLTPKEHSWTPYISEVWRWLWRTK